MTRWIAAGGAFVVSLDSMVNIAFPAMAAAFRLPPGEMRWVIIAYVLVYAVVSFPGGAAGDGLGHARVFRVGLAGSALGYFVVAGAPTFGWLVAGRALQGVAAGLVYGSAPALVTLAASPAARGRAVAFVNAAIALGFTLGPLAAGDLVARFGWPAVFVARAPLALATLAWALAALREPRVRLGAPRLVAGDVLRGPVVGLGALAFLAQAGIFAIWLLAPFYLVERRGLDPRTGGALFTLTPLGMALGAPLAGRMSDRSGPGLPVLAGLALEAGALLVLAGAGAATSLALVAGALFAAGLGVGVFQVPNMAALMAEFPAGRQGAAGGLAFLSRMLGTVGGVAVYGQLFALRAAAGFDAGLAAVFLAAAGLVAAAMLGACAILPRVCRRPTGG